MPIGIQRLNASRPQPSSQIIFIKPLPGPTMKYAQDFLERIAAICHPIMKANHLSIMTLEEHEPNPEFIGRNFNAGEIIQLVLKAPYTGHWLSFRSVQMVMMHELAHCMQMNHAKVFWEVNNRFKGELRQLWNKGYTGDGLWGRGQTLLSGEYHTGGHVEHEVLPANLCGGTFRSSRRGKRKRGGEMPRETYAERQQRRIKKRFGVNGTTLGSEEAARVKLENGKKPKGKPRVAGSARGRELRAAAALARFDQVKDEETKQDEESLLGDSETDSDDADTENEIAAIDIDGTRMRDGKGRGMVKVCADEDQDDVYVKREMEELHELDDDGSSTRIEGIAQTVRQPNSPVFEDNIRGRSTVARLANSTRTEPSSPGPPNPSGVGLYDIPMYVEGKISPPQREKSKPSQHSAHSADHIETPSGQSSTLDEEILDRPHYNHVVAEHRSDLPAGEKARSTPSTRILDEVRPNPAYDDSRTEDMTCPICSMTNEKSSLLCLACSHVLDTNKITRYWRCRSDACKEGQYINAADCGLCGVCGERKVDEEPT